MLQVACCVSLAHATRNKTYVVEASASGVIVTFRNG
jgi:hypothetical protein